MPGVLELDICAPLPSQVPDGFDAFLILSCSPQKRWPCGTELASSQVRIGDYFSALEIGCPDWVLKDEDATCVKSCFES